MVFSFNVRFGPKADIGVSITFRLTFSGRLRNRLSARIAHIREMVFQAGLDTAASRLNICAIFFDVRSTRVPDGTRLYQRKLAPQRKKILETHLDARDTALTRFRSRAMSRLCRKHRLPCCATDDVAAIVRKDIATIVWSACPPL
jgi:hypothetical protein